MLHFSNIYIKRKEVKLGSFCLKCNLQGEGSRNLTITTDMVWSALKSERLEGKVDGGARFQIPQRGTKKRKAGRKECKWKRGKQLKDEKNAKKGCRPETDGEKQDNNDLKILVFLLSNFPIRYNKARIFRTHNPTKSLIVLAALIQVALGLHSKPSGVSHEFFCQGRKKGE